MNRPARLLIAALLAITSAGAFPAAPGGAPVVAQDLVTLRTSSKVSAAIWTRRPDSSYTLQLVLWRSAFFQPATTTNINPAVSRSNLVDGARIANLRDLDPRSGLGDTAMESTRLEVAVWLLRADGTQILPALPSTNPAPDKCTGRCMVIEKLYRFSSADATQAVAAAVRIGDDFFIEKLQPLEQPQK